MTHKMEREIRRMERRGMDRRLFLKFMSVMGVTVALGSQGANAFSSKAKGKIVIVGGGAAGISTAAKLLRWLDTPDVTLIDPSDVQFYQPGFTLIAGGIYTPDVVKKSQASCMPSGVKWVKDFVTAIDPVTNKISTAEHGRVEYDFLVLTPGLQMNFDLVEGVSREMLGTGNAHCMYDYTGAQRTWKALREFAKTGGKGVFTNTFTKLKCGGAPKKIALLTEDYCRKQGSRDRVELAYYNGSKDLFDTPYFAKRLIEIFDERRVAHHPLHRLRGIDTQAKIAYFDITKKVSEEVKNEASGVVEKVERLEKTPIKVDYDFMHFTPPMSAPDFVAESGLNWNTPDADKNMWVAVDKETLVHNSYKNIICLGDCAGIPTSKTSAAIRMQYPVAAKNLISLMEGKEPVERYDGYTACPIITEYGKVLMAEFDYNKTPKPTLPFIDASHEQWASWILKKYMLKPIYFYGMLNGWM